MNPRRIPTIASAGLLGIALAAGGIGLAESASAATPSHDSHVSSAG